jgi:hypothetical protein
MDIKTITYDERGCFLPELEKWKSVTGYEGLYEISQYGRIKSLARTKVAKGNTCSSVKERIRVLCPERSGYLLATLCKDGKGLVHKSHLLVWDHFGDTPRKGRELQVDHKDENKLNNLIYNLQLSDTRANVSKARLTKDNRRSNYTGVQPIPNGRNKRWGAFIVINKKNTYIGGFATEIDASRAYQNQLDIIQQSRTNTKL